MGWVYRDGDVGLLLVLALLGLEVLGVIMLGDRVGGIPFSLQDFDLLKSVSDHAAAGLLPCLCPMTSPAASTRIESSTATRVTVRPIS